MLGLPVGVTTCLFDLDGVLTDTASVHQRAWKEMFDSFLSERAAAEGTDFVPFESRDYEEFVDGKPRLDGVRDFLASRGITLPPGGADSTPDDDSVTGLGLRKNAIVLRRIREDGVDVFEGSRRYLHAAVEAGLRRAVVSSSANAEEVLEAADLADMIELRVDGVTIGEHFRDTSMTDRDVP